MASPASKNRLPYRSIALSVASAVLAGCIAAPGMRMQLPPTIAANAAAPDTSATSRDHVPANAPTCASTTACAASR